MVREILKKLARVLSPYVYECIKLDLKSYMPLRTFDYDVANFIVFNQVEGDYLEFGAYKGDGLISFYNALKEHWALYEEHAFHFNHQYDRAFFDKKKFVAFDSFQGLPAEIGEGVPGHFAKKGTYTVSQEAFWKNIQAQLPKNANVDAVPGFFNETLTQETKEKLEIEKAALVFIDCDLYDSAVDVFGFLAPLLTDGTVIVMDDFYRYKGNPRYGVQGAFEEWRAGVVDFQFYELARVAANRVAFICSKNK